ncbi:uncharacterized protein [Haliotis cracherodii]|uniref:uncharacterized protein n=1 Tax=Haliotis cracherodii TaxID=6455 RepID=UPI0039E8D53E
MSGHEDKDQCPPGTSEEAGAEIGAKTEFTMDHGTGQTLTIPTADAVVDPRDGGKAWCSVFVVVILTSLMEALIVLQQPTLFYMNNTNISSGGDEESQWLLSSNPPADVLTVLDTYKALFSISGILSGILTVLAGCRWMALIGSVLTAVGYLGAAFSDLSNVPLISFLYGALPG